MPINRASTAFRAGLCCAGLLALVACKGEEAQPDLAYKVTVKSATDDGALVTDCVDSGQVFNKTFQYQLFFEGAALELKVDGESFATGSRTGCDLSYESAVWLEERDAGLVRWQLFGDTTYEGAAGSCDLPDNLDWQGVEVIEVMDSEDEDIPVGCTYELNTEGTLVSG